MTCKERKHSLACRVLALWLAVERRCCVAARVCVRVCVWWCICGTVRLDGPPVLARQATSRSTGQGGASRRRRRAADAMATPRHVFPRLASRAPPPMIPSPTHPHTSSARP